MIIMIIMSKAYSQIIKWPILFSIFKRLEKQFGI